MDSETKQTLISATTELILTKGLPALVKFVTKINQENEKKPVTIEDIEAVKGELDSRSYFEDVS
jgi:hypothetical protein